MIERGATEVEMGEDRLRVLPASRHVVAWGNHPTNNYIRPTLHTYPPTAQPSEYVPSSMVKIYSGETD